MMRCHNEAHHHFLLNVIIQLQFIQRLMHAGQPGLGPGRCDGKWEMPGPEPGMPIGLGIEIRSAKKLA